MAAKPAIPAEVAGASNAQRRFNTTVKENIELLTGKRPDSVVSSLASTASLADVIAKINELITHMQG